MKREEFGRRLDEQLQGVRVSPALMQRTLLAAQGKEQIYMKKKMTLAAALALLAVLLCAAALAAAGRWGMLDFAGRYADAYIPADAQDYVKTDVTDARFGDLDLSIRELYYDGLTVRATVDVRAREEGTLLVGGDNSMYDPYGNLWAEEKEGVTILDAYQAGGYTQATRVSMYLTDETGESVSGMMDYVLDADGTLTYYLQEEFAVDRPLREILLEAFITPYLNPAEDELDNDSRSRAGQRLTMTAADVKKAGEADSYISQTPVDYPSVGVRVDMLRIDVKPQELYATIEYTITDREKYDALEGGLWFEFVDPQSTQTEPHEQRLRSGMSGGGSAGPADGDLETATRYIQRETLGRNELHETYTLRAYDAWEKERFESNTFVMREAQ